MPEAAFELTIKASEQEKTVHATELSATVTGCAVDYESQIAHADDAYATSSL
jgi:hypothetical protein